MTTIRCIDFETTGIPTEADKHAIVEIGKCDVRLIDGVATMEAAHTSALCDPGRSIPHEAMAVHHITDAMVKGAQGSAEHLGRPDYFAAHNADYERQFFSTDVPFICTYKVALRLWPEAPSHSLQFLRYHLGLEVDADRCQPPHRAGPDAYLGAALMVRILAEDSVSLEDMVRWSNGPALLPRINFGKHKGSKWEDVPLDYLTWIVDKSDLDRDVKANARHHLKVRAV
jgi:exodeoxyribonuclease X